MNTNDTNRQKAHAMIDHIFKDLLPAQGMAERSEQIKLSHRMLDTMLNGGIALCDAGTGIGKTYAYLVAAAAANRSDTEALRKPVIISTSASPCRTPCRRNTFRCCPASCWQTDRSPARCSL